MDTMFHVRRTGSCVAAVLQTMRVIARPSAAPCFYCGVNRYTHEDVLHSGGRPMQEFESKSQLM